MTDEEYGYLKTRLLEMTGMNLDNYKTQQMRRRLTSYVEKADMGVAEFCASLTRDPEALASIRDYMTINVSEFFRDRAEFQRLEKVILPQLLERRLPLRIWSAGSSRGQEAYTLALLLRTLDPTRDHSVLATDIDERCLAIGRNGGPYSAADVVNVGPAILEASFRLLDGSYFVKDSLKSMVKFKRHDLMADQFVGRFDLILCRNVVIYFADEAKANLFKRFSQALAPGGFLYIGATESLLNPSEIGLESVSSYCFQNTGQVSRQLVAKGA